MVELGSAELLAHLLKQLNITTSISLKKEKTSPNPKHLTISLIKVFVSSFLPTFESHKDHPWRVP